MRYAAGTMKAVIRFSTSVSLLTDHWTPFFDHLIEAWDKRHNPNMLFLFYEELSKVNYIFIIQKTEHTNSPYVNYFINYNNGI